MTTIIVYPRKDGGVCIIRPMVDWPIEQVAEKDVPSGRPYIIVDDSVLPPDREFRDAWEADFSKPDGFGGEHGVQEQDGA